MNKSILFLMAFVPSISFAEIEVQSSPAKGKWCGDFVACSNYVEKNDIPLVLVWGQDPNVGYCEYCAALEAALSTPEATAELSKLNAIFCFCQGQKTTNGNAAHSFAKTTGGNNLEGWPYVCFYWPRQDKAVNFTGRDGEMLSKEGSGLLAQFVNSFNAFTEREQGGDNPPPDVPSSPDLAVEYDMVTFPFGSLDDDDRPDDRLEVIAGKTEYIDVPIVRPSTGDSGQVFYECWLGHDELISDGAVVWKDGENLCFVRVNIPSDVNLEPGWDYFDFWLCEEDHSVLDNRYIEVVEDPENTPKNPYWIGERTASQLQWGEWSMDLDAVKEKVRTYKSQHPGEKAYAMVVVQGSCWCPDCAMAEKNVFGTAEFKAWAQSKHVVFGVVDIPKYKTEDDVYPSLLRYETYETSDDYVTLRGSVSKNEDLRYQSGAGYLSRHSVPYSGTGVASAASIAERNRFLVSHHTSEGGLSDKFDQLRTGVPTLILMQDDGTVGARWKYFATVGPKTFEDCYLRRFDEMLLQAADEYEEEDDTLTGTRRMIEADGDAVSSTLSVVDQADYYLITEVEANSDLEVTLSGDAGELKMSIIDRNSGETVASNSGLAASELAVKAKLGDSQYALKIEPKTIAETGYFGYTSESSSVCHYTVSASAGGSCGEIGFVKSVISVNEDCGTVDISVARTAGNNGAASVTVRLIEVIGTDGAQRYVWSSVGELFSWDDRKDGVQTKQLKINNTPGVMKGSLRLTFELTDLKGKTKKITLGNSRLTVNVSDVDVKGKSVYRTVRFSDIIPVDGYQPGDEIRFSCTGGSLPAGISLVRSGGVLSVSGVATAAEGVYSAVYEVTLVRGGVPQEPQTVTLDYTVFACDFAALFPFLSPDCVYPNLPMIEDDQLKGLLTLHLPDDGSLSAKYLTAGETFSYATDCWESYDPGTGVLTATLQPTAGNSKTLRVQLTCDGGIAELMDPVSGTRREFQLPANPWPKGAAPWQGRYTVQMPQTVIRDGWSKTRLAGAAGMVLRMLDDDVATGTMTYVGFLPNGRTVVGSVLLTTNAVGQALVPFYHVSKNRAAPYVYSGCLAVLDRAAREAGRLWCVSNCVRSSWSVADGYGHEGTFAAYGGYYDPEKVADSFRKNFSVDLTDFAFAAETGSVSSGLYGSGIGFTPVPLTMADDNRVLVSSAKPPTGMVLAFSPETGVLSGRFVVRFDLQEEMHSVSATYRAVALPGWQTCPDCSDDVFVERPWAVGACSFADRVKGQGVFRNGCAVKADKYK